MAGPAQGANSGEVSPGAGNGQADSPLTALSEIADRVRNVASERLGPERTARLRSMAEEKLKAVGGDRLPAGAGDRLRGVRGDAAGATVAAPPFEERPELYVGAAFAGGIVLAGFIRLLGR